MHTQSILPTAVPYPFQLSIRRCSSNYLFIPELFSFFRFEKSFMSSMKKNFSIGLLQFNESHSFRSFCQDSMSISTPSFLSSRVSVKLFPLTSSRAARSIGGRGFLQYWNVLYCQKSSLCWLCTPSAPCGLPALSTVSPPPAARLTWGSPCSPGGGSPGSRPQLCSSGSSSPPPRRLRGADAGSAMVPASPRRLRGRAAPDGGTQSGGSSGKSLSRSRFQGTRNVSGSAARRLAMGQGWGSREPQPGGGTELGASRGWTGR